MRKFLFDIAAILILFYIINIGYLSLLKINKQFSKTQDFASFKDQSFDVLITGFSLSMNGINPEIFEEEGFSSYNFSLGGTHVSSSIVMLKSYLEKNKPPKVLIYGTSNAYYDKYISEQITKDAYNPIVSHFFIDQRSLSPLDLPLFKFKWLAFEILKMGFSKDFRFENYNGQIRSLIKREDQTNTDNFTEFHPSLYKNNVYISELAQICRQYNIQFILVEMPTWKEHQHLNYSRVSKIEDYFILEANHINFVEENFISDVHWASDNHLNVLGSEVLTKQIFQDLMECKILE